jgi:hypothetical protein
MDGTRFRLFPQPSYLEGFEEPETVTIASPPGSIGPGPSDERMYAVRPVDKPAPYGTAAHPTAGTFLPPWTRDIVPPPVPGADGHFDHLEPGTPQFEAAHLFGTVHYVVDIWERYFGRQLNWHFAKDYDRLELSILPELNNGYAGYGFIEVGGEWSRDRYDSFSLNFDVVAHEVGHLIIYGELGVPSPRATRGEYFGFHESAADLVALVSSLHFNSVVDELLLTTGGNLYMYNLFNRMAELSDNDEIRIAANDRRLREFARGWVKEHDLSEPLTGAFFDIFVDMFHDHLVEARVISPEMEALSDRLLATPQYAPVMQRLFDRAFADHPGDFKLALLDTRDLFGTYLAETWMRLDADHLNYANVADTFEAVDHAFSGGRYRRHIRGSFDMRDIGYVRVGPQLEPFRRDSHAASARTLVPGAS